MKVSLGNYLIYGIIAAMHNDHLNTLAQEQMRAAIQKVAVGPDRGRDLSQEEAAQAMQAILEGRADEVQTAVLLIALRMKRESIDEFVGLFDALQSSIDCAVTPVTDLLCLADPFDGYVRNVTMTPFIPCVLAACGMTALLHGVAEVGPKFGVTAQQVYARAGITVDHTAKTLAAKLVCDGWGYIDQARYAPRLYSLLDLRNRMVKRSALTTLERLLMPIRAQQNTHLVLGYVHKAYPQIYATVARHAGYDSVLLTKGVEGGLAPALNKPLRRFFFAGQLSKHVDDHKELIDQDTLFASAFNSSKAAMSMGNETDRVQTCLDVGLRVLAGEKDGELSTARDSLSLAAGQIVMSHTHSLSLPEAVEKVRASLDNGTALEKFERVCA